MEQGYEIEPERIGRSASRRRPVVAIVLALAVVAVALVKPWDLADPDRSPAVRATSGPGVAVAVATPAPRVGDARPVAAAPDTVAIWPSARTPSLLATQTAEQ